LPEDTTGWSSFSVFSFRVDGQLSPITELRAGVTYSRGAATFLQNATSFTALGARVDHWMSERVGIFATAESFHSQFAGVLSSTASGRQRFLGGIEVLLSPRIRYP
jgi:hypothetical protein